MTPSWEDTTRSELARLRLTEGWTLRRIATRYGISVERVRQQCLAWSLRPPAKNPAWDAWAALPRETLVQLYHDAHLTQAQIAARCGVGRKAVAARLKRDAIPAARQGRSAWASVTPAELKDLYEEQELTCREVGARYGVVESAVRKKLAAHNIARRERGSRNRGERERLAAWRQLTRAELYRLYWTEDQSSAAIGGRYGVIGDTVRHRLKAWDIPRKPRGHNAHPPGWWASGRARLNAAAAAVLGKEGPP